MGAAAEFERPLSGERQPEGIALVKGRGVYRGRKKALVEDQVIELRRRAGAGEPKVTLAREFGISSEKETRTFPSRVHANRLLLARLVDLVE